MRNVNLFSKISAIVGTLLALFPYFFLFYATIDHLIRSGRFAFDFLLPMELFFIDIPGALILLGISLYTRTLRPLICTSAFASVLLLIGTQLYAILTGLATGEIEAEGIIFTIALILTGLFAIAPLITGIGGVILVVKLFRYKKPILQA